MGTSEQVEREIDSDGPMIYLLNLCTARGRKEVHKLVAPGEVWHERIDDKWDAWINPHRVPAEIPAPASEFAYMTGKVDPFSAWINYNGWLWGLVDPFGGTVGVGEGANVETFAAACLAAASPTLNSAVPGEQP